MKPALWFIFIAWSAVGLLSLALGLNPAWLDGRNLGGPLKDFLLSCLHWGDFCFIALAFANLLLAAMETWGKREALRAAAAILLGAALLETVGTLSGQPFGFYTYTKNFGPRIGVLPLAIPLAWFLVVAGFRLILDRHAVTRSLPRWPKVLAIAACATAFDWILEPFAWQVRAYWLWLDGAIPLQNYMAWFVSALFFAAYALPQKVSRPADARPVWILGMMILFFCVGRFGS